MSKSKNGMRKSKGHRKSKRSKKRTSKIKREGKWTMDTRSKTKSK